MWISVQSLCSFFINHQLNSCKLWKLFIKQTMWSSIIKTLELNKFITLYIRLLGLEMLRNRVQSQNALFSFFIFIGDKRRLKKNAVLSVFTFRLDSDTVSPRAQIMQSRQKAPRYTAGRRDRVWVSAQDRGWSLCFWRRAIIQGSGNPVWASRSSFNRRLHKQAKVCFVLHRLQLLWTVYVVVSNYRPSCIWT